MIKAKKDSRRFKDKTTRDAILAGEKLHGAWCITDASQFNNPDKLITPGGMCACCGAGPRIDTESDWWLVFRAGICDVDGEYMGMLCGGPDGSGCLPDIREDATKRRRSGRDEAADIINDLLGDDIDGAMSMMEDLGDCLDLED